MPRTMTKAAIDYLKASGATAISVVAIGGVCYCRAAELPNRDDKLIFREGRRRPHRSRRGFGQHHWGRQSRGLSESRAHCAWGHHWDVRAQCPLFGGAKRTYTKPLTVNRHGVPDADQRTKLLI
jgi:hypothetical protein